MNKYTKIIVLFLLGVALILGYSSISNKPNDPVGSSTETVTAPVTHTIVDMSGNEVTLPVEIKRVVNLWPASNSVMLCLGAGDLLIGTHNFTKGLPWSQFVYPEIMDVPIGSSNAEELLKIEPDLIITPQEDLAKSLREAGLNAVMLMFQDYDSMKQAFSLLGDILGGEYKQKTDLWAAMVDENIATVSKAVGDIPETEKPIVYYIQGQSNQGLYTTFRGDSIMNDWTTYAAGRFASKLLNLTGGTVTPEEILTLNPDVVIIGGPAQHELYEELMAAEEWTDIKAVKNGRVYTNPNGLFPWERFGMESALQILWATSVIHPELFQIDMVRTTQEFYKDFVGIELTAAQAQNMLNGYGPDGK